jgi:hypothetical protein
VGGVSGRPSREVGRSNPFEGLAVATVKGIPVCGMTALFAGRRPNAGLGRSVRRKRGSSPSGGRTDDRGCPEDAEDGNDVGLRDETRRHPSREASAISRSGRTRPSFGPLTRARRSPLQLRGATPGGGALESISRSGKPAQAGGTGTGVETSGRSAARRVSPLPQGRPRDASKKRKGVTALVPARIVRARAQCPFIVFRCRSRQATSGPK